MMFSTPPQSEDQMKQEARRLCEMFADQPHLLLSLLSTQLGVLKQQAQILMGLCGLAITVTGFSGAHMIRAGSTASFSMVTGIALILIAVFLCLSILTQLRWVTQDLCDSLYDATLSVITRRNHQQRRLFVAGMFVALGLAAYLLAVVIAALTPTPIP